MSVKHNIAATYLTSGDLEIASFSKHEQKHENSATSDPNIIPYWHLILDFLSHMPQMSDFDVDYVQNAY